LRRTVIALIPFVIAVPALIVAVILWRSSLPATATAPLFGIVGAILGFDVPVCVFVLVKWLRAGEPPELSLAPLLPTRQEREFRRALRERRKLDDEAFYEEFYAHSDVPSHLPAKLRRLLETITGLNLASLWPSDNLVEGADGEIDWADVFYLMEREFKVSIPRERWREFDGTFRSLLGLIVARADKTDGSGDSTISREDLCL
jgi:hypothetical protein